MMHQSNVCSRSFNGILIGAMLLASGTFRSVADIVEITAPKTVLPGATTITPTAGGAPVPLANAEIRVIGTELTMSGQFTIKSLSVQRNVNNQPGVLTHGASGGGADGLRLTITGSNGLGLFVEGANGPNVGSRIDVSGKGFAGSTGPGRGGSSVSNGGGGAYGGAGADAEGSSQAAVRQGLGGFCYGDNQEEIIAPFALGSGGGDAWNGQTRVVGSGGAGGGSITLIVAGGSTTINGDILANGFAGTRSSTNAGGGSGGSISLVCGGVLTGSGLLAANGGEGPQGCCSGRGGGGGGGRISIVGSGVIPATLRRVAYGAVGSIFRGGAGTVYTKAGAARGQLLIDNSIADGESTEFNAPTALVGMDVVVQNGGRIGPYHGQTNFDLTIDGDLFIAQAGAVAADGRGNSGSQGLGAGRSANGLSGGGAGYGGAGGDADWSTHAGPIAGGLGGPCFLGSTAELYHPFALGSGGGNIFVNGTQDPDSGGAGGGAIRLVVNGTLTVNGSISADGSTGVRSGINGGGGSGGSLDITCGTLAGSLGGVISVNGGSGGTGCCNGSAGGGGGGRAGIHYGTSTFAGQMQAIGGSGSVYGGGGTFYTKRDADPRGTLVINNGTNYAESTEFSVPTVIDANVQILDGGRLGPAHLQDGFDLTINGSLEVLSGGAVYADGRGRVGSQGPGAGRSANGFSGGGAGYGGAGADADGSTQGAQSPGGLGGPCYLGTSAKLYRPSELGSGGGNTFVNGVPDPLTGGFGGGAIRLAVNGTLTVNGSISANGAAGARAGVNGGGGSGGSLDITCATFAGSSLGIISVNGGSGGTGCCNGSGGGGGGGRAGIQFAVSTFEGQMQAVGGSGSGYGGAGTFYTKRYADQLGTLVINNGTNYDETTEFTAPTVIDANVSILDGGRLGPAHRQTGFNVTVNGDLDIADTGAIYAQGRGSLGSSGPGAGGSAVGASGGGGGFGGVGGSGRLVVPITRGGSIYGARELPGQLGSGGGNAYSGNQVIVNSGGAGGGSINLTVLGTVMLDGELNANGDDGARGSFNGGGGSGGSIVLSGSSILGNGVISADGGEGGAGCCGGTGGGGGGGRISIIASQIAPIVQALGGAGLVAGSAGTIFETPPCRQDFNRDGGVDGADIESFFVAWAAGGPDGDYNQDGGVDGSDIATFFPEWEAGC